jgi:hypothetical protein
LRRRYGDNVGFTANPPGTVISGAITNPGGFVWTGNLGKWDGTIPSEFCGSHSGLFNGKYVTSGSGTGGPLTWQVDTHATVPRLTMDTGGCVYALIGSYLVTIWAYGVARPEPQNVVITGNSKNFREGESINMVTKSTGAIYKTINTQVSLRPGYGTSGEYTATATYMGISVSMVGNYSLEAPVPPIE